MSSYLFICSIGPVQGFIAAARSSRDLAYGSWLLSELAKAAAKALYEKRARLLIFPAPEHPDEDLKPGSPLNVSNRVLAVIEGEPKDWAEVARNAVVERLQGEMQHAFKHAERKWNLIFPEIVHKRTRQQMEDLLEMYWAAAPYLERTEEAYSKARERALRTLDLRKNTRDFEPWEGIPGLPKSVLDGFREAVVVVKGPSNRDSAKVKRYENRPDMIQVLEEQVPILREGEALSGVDLFKRLGGYAFKPPKTDYDGVPSTSDVAAQPLIVRIGKNRAKQWQQRVIQRLREQEVADDQAKSETLGVYFFVDRAADLITGEEKYERQRRFRQVFEQDWELELGKDTPRPHPYYALLAADGDSMGALIDDQDSEEEHRNLSQKLSVFAQTAETIIRYHQGYPIYTGGDDVRALLPLHTVLDALEALDQAFGKAMQDFAHPHTGKPPTLSGGLVITHHLTPLEDVLATAREAEAYAKEKPGKHGLTVVLLRRGGEVVRVRDTWSALVEHIRFWAALRQRSLFPRGLPYDLQQLAEFLKPTDLPSEGYQAEVKRVFKQKRERKDEAAWEALAHEVSARFQSDRRKHPARLLLQIAYEMRLALEVAKARDIAKADAYSLTDEKVEEAAA